MAFRSQDFQCHAQHVLCRVLVSVPVCLLVLMHVESTGQCRVLPSHSPYHLLIYLYLFILCESVYVPQDMYVLILHQVGRGD